MVEDPPGSSSTTPEPLTKKVSHRRIFSILLYKVNIIKFMNKMLCKVAHIFSSKMYGCSNWSTDGTFLPAF